MFAAAPSASLPVTVTAVREQWCERRASHVVTQSLSSHLILTTTRVPRGHRRADQSQPAATVTKKPPLDPQMACKLRIWECEAAEKPAEWAESVCVHVHLHV